MGIQFPNLTLTGAVRVNFTHAGVIRAYTIRAVVGFALCLKEQFPAQQEEYQ